MNKYIPADKLIAEIERLHKAHSGKYGCDEVGVNLEYLEDFITSLQQESKDKDVFIQKAIQWMCNTTPIDDVLSVEMIEDFKKTMMEE